MAGMRPPQIPETRCRCSTRVSSAQAAGGTEGDLTRLAGWKSRSIVDLYAKATAEQRARAAHARLGLGDRIYCDILATRRCRLAL
jgi:hypothetical protein